MKISALHAALIVSAVVGQNGDSELEKTVKDKLKALHEVTAALKTVPDVQTAGAALGKMEAALERLIVCDEILGDPKTAALLKKEKLPDKFGKELAGALANVDKEVQRLSKEPQVVKPITQAALWKRWQKGLQELQASNAAQKAVIDQNKLQRAKLDVKSLQTALTAYLTINGAYPESLADLSRRQPKGGAALLKAEGLTDPWNRPYQYDPNQRNRKTDVPRVWSQGPEPGQPGSEIANWTPDAAPPKSEPAAR
jgi:hypothetical protein